ncbi:MAG: GNAT family N-acetyltransferase [Bacteroidales bacterium]|nr:GNAT family N-acetyltransferase [Bacteroidales bacterium]
MLSEQDHNVALLCLAEEYPLLEVIQEGTMLMCRFQSDEEWCHFSHNSTHSFIKSFFRQYNRGQYVVISDDKVFDQVQQDHRKAWSIACYRLFQDDDHSLQEYPGLQIIRPEHLQVVYDNSKYQQFLSLEYLNMRLQLGGGFCIERDGQPVAWAMTHDDGSVGMLHVLDQYRGLGYARLLVLAMSGEVRKINRPVFAHIEPVNFPSLNLFRSLGFEVRSKVTWAFFK